MEAFARSPFTAGGIVMRIAVVSDTHGHVAYTLEAVRMLESLDVEQVIHCGDIGSVKIVELFSAWPTHFVFGNVDLYEMAELRAAIEAAGQHCHERFGQLELAGRHIAFLHSDDILAFQQAASSDKWDLVCYGHTHLADTRREGSTLLLNPGALYRATPHSFALVELPDLKIETISL
jgi:putative phosphoesterase